MVIILIRVIALNKLPKTSFLIMWGIALTRLLVPFSLPSRLSFSGVAGELVNLMGVESLASETDKGFSVWSIMMQQTETISNQRAILPTSPFITIWLLGMFLFFSMVVLWYWISFQKLRDATPVEEPGAIRDWLDAHDSRRSLILLRTNQVRTPITTGILHHRIYLPYALDINDEQTVQFIFTHENVHIRRGDVFWKILALCAVCIHWFNPMAWVMLIYLNRDLELTCDEMVLRRLGDGVEAKKYYAYSLISMAERKSTLSPVNSYFNQNGVKERIVAIMKYKKSSAFSILLSFVIVLILLIVFTTKSETQDLITSQSSVQNTESETVPSRLFLPLEGVLIKASRADIEQYLNAESDQERERILESLLSDENNTIIEIEKTIPPSQGGAAVADTPG